MDAEHIPDETVRAYLLGTVTEEDAAAIEELYFVKRSCLLHLKAAERTLIENYLDGVLNRVDARQFESRYLRIPALVRIVEKVKRERTAGGWRLSRRLVVASAGALLCLAATGIWIFVNRRTGGVPAPRDLRSAAAPGIILRLTPGVTMGEPKVARLSLPADHTLVRLIAELPGVITPIECEARVSLVGADGQLSTVWSTASSQTSPASGGQELSIQFDTSVLRAGDYMAQVASRDGKVREKYVFRVGARP